MGAGNLSMWVHGAEQPRVSWHRNKAPQESASAEPSRDKGGNNLPWYSRIIGSS